jgi:hypothetical protein
MTNFDVKQCHKWAQLLIERKTKLDQALEAIAKQDFELAKQLTNQIFSGTSSGRQTDSRNDWFLLYHMAMVTKMGSEHKYYLKP